MRVTRDDKGSQEETSPSASKSFFDLNQFELSIVNIAIKDATFVLPVSFPNFSSLPLATLKQQKKNLESLIRKFGSEKNPKLLGEELKKILLGERTLSFNFFSPLFEKFSK